MKIRWKEHELIFVTMLVIIQMMIYLKGFYDASQGGTGHIQEISFDKAGLPFVYWKQVFVPQILSVFLLFVSYLSVTLLIMPMIKRISFRDVERFISGNIIQPVLVILVTGFVLATGMNILTWYARPHLSSYAGFRWIALLGYNERPLSDVFQGMGEAFGVLGVMMGVAAVREFICWLIGRPDGQRDFRVMVVNNITPLLFFYLFVLILLNPAHYDFQLFFGLVTPVFLVYIFSTFWIFPFKGDASFFHRPVLIRILGSTCSWSLLSVVAFKGPKPLLFFLMYWAFLLFAIIPLCWLLYRQRRDQILQLKGMQTALARSDADLQLLRAQINPHFLFNALNTLYATALQKDSEKTAQGIQQLGDMMRFMLEDNNREFIPMEKEVDYLKNFINLQQLRLLSSPNIVVEENLDDVRCHHTIAPMLFIPFVENAYKHGISLKERSWICINMECTDQEIRFEVRNSIHARTDLEAGRTGIGLQNVKGRLELLYPGRHEMSAKKNGNEFIAKLCIQLNNTTKGYVAGNRN